MLPCEVSAKYVLPAIRLMIARKLIDEYNFTQAEVAKLLGVSQPSVSHYLNSKRGARVAKILTRSKEVREYVDRYVKEILATGAPPRDTSFCKICRTAVKRVLGKKAELVQFPKITG